jgi:hypothetical protein
MLSTMDEARGILFRACNYQDDVDGFTYVVEPFIDVYERCTDIVGLWNKELSAEAYAATSGVVWIDQVPTFDREDGLIFLRLGSDDPVLLVAVLRRLAQLGWSTGIA